MNEYVLLMAQYSNNRAARESVQKEQRERAINVQQKYSETNCKAKLNFDQQTKRHTENEKQKLFAHDLMMIPSSCHINPSENGQQDQFHDFGTWQSHRLAFDH